MWKMTMEQIMFRWMNHFFNLKNYPVFRAHLWYTCLCTYMFRLKAPSFSTPSPSPHLKNTKLSKNIACILLQTKFCIINSTIIYKIHKFYVIYTSIYIYLIYIIYISLYRVIWLYKYDIIYCTYNLYNLPTFFFTNTASSYLPSEIHMSAKAKQAYL